MTGDHSEQPGRAIRIGCSGWSYQHWRGLFYPEDLPTGRWFEHYAAAFDTVELNTTFYRLPTARAVADWREAGPPGFCYAIKMGSYGTHRKKLKDVADWVPNHLERAELLGSTLGPTLIQLPPRWRVRPDRLDALLAYAPDGQQWAVEVRDASWLCDEVYTVLERHGAALCIHDLLADHPFRLTADWTYLRFHGPRAVEQPYRGRYGPERLEPFAARIEELVAGGTTVWCYFNNDDRAYAIDDARWLAERLGVASGVRS